MKPKVCVITTDGTNCDRELAYTFGLAGAEAEIVHMNTLIKGYNPANPEKRDISLEQFDILGIPGGFSHGDYIAAGKIWEIELEHALGKQIEKFVADGKPMIGICNGFQVLVKYGLLPKLDDKIEQNVTLTYNKRKHFECRAVRLVKPEPAGDKCIWTTGIDNLVLPVAHGEGNFAIDEKKNPGLRDRLFEQGLVVFQYADMDNNPTNEFPYNPNGSLSSIAAISDSSGLIFGLMPHPERYSSPENHYLFTLQRILEKDYVDRNDPAVRKIMEKAGSLAKEGPGIQIFRNAVNYAKENL